MFAVATFCNAYAVTYYTVANGAWSGSIWATCSTCTGSTLPVLNDGDILVIDDRVTIASSTVTIAARITIELTTDASPNTTTSPAKLIFTTGGKLVLSNSQSSVILINLTANSTNDPIIDGSGAGASNIISIGGTNYWQANNGDLQGTGTLQPGATLPVKLNSLHGELENGQIVITWVTSLEHAFSHFNILHSADGLFYEVVDLMPGAGLNVSGILNNYRYTHDQPMMGFNYYRLQAVDLDGRYETFGPIAIKVEQTQKFVVYPNPIYNHTIRFKRNFQPSEADCLTIFDQVGHLIKTVAMNSIEDEIILDEGFEAGIYYLNYISEGYDEVVRIIVDN